MGVYWCENGSSHKSNGIGSSAVVSAHRLGLCARAHRRTSASKWTEGEPSYIHPSIATHARCLIAFYLDTITPFAYSPTGALAC
jgi:hypothetical protein